ncbi:solute carrier family 23 protein [Streptomyces angustmyceticus]|uniref:uracil-xanthine permease family protein n=2 Tax=Streptomyces angustmyceticus TaxID=285578 RepID=UPI001C3F6F15|nr:solute carrier family 23 protein [Streptomyces angustmyceticus]UAL65932.1 nitrate reductase [Streptomyces angustmyceticus]
MAGRFGVGWTLHGDGSAPAPGRSVRPDERLSWPLTIGLGIQHVVAMFGATFVFPTVMGLDANLAVMMSGLATVVFLLIVKGKIPSYLGTSAAFVGSVAAIRAAGGSTPTVLGAIVVSGLVMAAFGILVHTVGARLIHRLFPPAVSGAVVLLIGFNLAPVVSGTYWPQDQWVAFATMSVVVAATALLRGFWARIAIVLGLLFGFALSWCLDRLSGPIHAPDAAGHLSEHFRVDLSGVMNAPWFGLPHMQAPDFRTSAVLMALPALVALIAENTGHVKAVAEMTHTDLDSSLGRAIAADGLTTALSAAVGGAPTTTFAENIGVMAATRVYSTAAYWVAAAVAVLFGLCPKFGALVAATPGGVLGGITVVLYGMIGLLGAKIWIANRVDFNDPVNLVSVATGTVMGIGGTSLQLSGTFTINGIALGTLVTLITYHLLRTRTSRRVPLPPSHHDRPARDRPEAGQATALAPAAPLPPSPASR